MMGRSKIVVRLPRSDAARASVVVEELWERRLVPPPPPGTQAMTTWDALAREEVRAEVVVTAVAVSGKDRASPVSRLRGSEEPLAKVLTGGAVVCLLLIVFAATRHRTEQTLADGNAPQRSPYAGQSSIPPPTPQPVGVNPTGRRSPSPAPTHERRPSPIHHRTTPHSTPTSRASTSEAPNPGRTTNEAPTAPPPPPAPSPQPSPKPSPHPSPKPSPPPRPSPKPTPKPSVSTSQPAPSPSVKTSPPPSPKPTVSIPPPAPSPSISVGLPALPGPLLAAERSLQRYWRG